MDKSKYIIIENYMKQCMGDSAHDKEHIYRVLYTALDIAQTEPEADTDILVAACLLHDIGRREQFENPSLCHAKVGAEKAKAFLLKEGFGEKFAKQVYHAIEAHRFRGDNPPQTIEAKILFDSDKIDATGTLGIARTLLYNGKLGEPLYSLDENGFVSDGRCDTAPSFFQEYCFKLERVYSKIITARGREIAEERRQSAEAFYNSMYSEASVSYQTGKELLLKNFEKN